MVFYNDSHAIIKSLISLIENMIIGYARTSTIEQQAGFDAQLRELHNVGCTKIFQEQVSSQGTRVQLSAAIEFAREEIQTVVIPVTFH